VLLFRAQATLGRGPDRTGILHLYTRRGSAAEEHDEVEITGSFSSRGYVQPAMVTVRWSAEAVLSLLFRVFFPFCLCTHIVPGPVITLTLRIARPAHHSVISSGVEVWEERLLDCQYLWRGSDVRWQIGDVPSTGIVRLPDLHPNQLKNDYSLYHTTLELVVFSI
jgi:hypothetical protein